MYLSLSFKSVKVDAGVHSGKRVKALIRRFVQVLVSGGGATEFVAGGLFLLGEVSVFYRERNSHLFVPWLYSSIPGLRAMINSPTKAEGGLYDAHKRDPTTHMPRPRLCGNLLVPFFSCSIDPSLIYVYRPSY